MRMLFQIMTILGTCFVAAGQQRELQAGPFPHIPDATLGARLEFENDIDSSYCYPLAVSGTVVAWLAQAYAFDGRLFVQRCIEYLDPTFPQGPGTRHGGESQWWEEARLSADRDVLLTTRLKLSGWSFLANASFCGASVAYWAFRGADLVPTIYDLRARAVTATQSLGRVSLETDNKGVLPQPVWSANCSEASFDGRHIERPVLRLKAPSRK